MTNKTEHGWAATTPPLGRDDIITIAGKWQRRTLIEWLKRTPKRLQIFRIK